MRAGAGTAAAAVLLLLLAGLGGCEPGSDGGRLYVASGFTDEVFVLGARDGRVLRTVPVDPRPMETDEPHGVALGPDRRFWYATVHHGEPAVWKFDLRDDARVGRVHLETPGAARIRLTSDGTRALVPDYWRSGLEKPGGLAVVRLGDLAVERRITLCAAPHDAAVDPSGAWVAVTCALGDEVLILDAATLEVRARASAGPRPGPSGRPAYAPLNVAWSPSGEVAYVTLQRSGEVIAVEPGGRVAARLEVGGGPTQIASTPDGTLLVVPLREEGGVALVSTDPLRVTGRVALPEAPRPHGVAVDGEGRRAFATYEGTASSPGGVVALSLPGGRILWSREAGQFTLGIAYAPPPP